MLDVFWVTTYWVGKQNDTGHEGSAEEWKLWPDSLVGRAVVLQLKGQGFDTPGKLHVWGGLGQDTETL